VKTEQLFDGELWYATEGAWAYGEHGILPILDSA